MHRKYRHIGISSKMSFSRSSFRLLSTSLVVLLVSATPSLSSAIVREIPSTTSRVLSKARYIAFSLGKSHRKRSSIDVRYRFSCAPYVSLDQSAMSFDGTDSGDDSLIRQSVSILPILVDVRGGGGISTRKSSLAEKVQERQRRRKLIIIWATISTTLLGLAYRERALWTPFLNKGVIQDKTLAILGALQPAENTGPYGIFRALSIYTLGMAVWEMAGLSTIPVETAAGMVFGFTQAAIASLLGKLMGATLAYTAGRTILASRIATHKAFTNNAVFQLLNNKNNGIDGKTITARHPPLMTAFFMKFSCFPEVIKNLGSSLIPVIRPWMFIVATALHGGFFTLIWTWLGVDSAARMQQTAMPVNRPLQAALVAAMIIGGVITPMIMAWWMNDLKHGAMETEASKRVRRDRLDAIMSTTSVTHHELAENSDAAVAGNGVVPWQRLKHRMAKAQVWIVGFLGTLIIGTGGSL